MENLNQSSILQTDTYCYSLSELVMCYFMKNHVARKLSFTEGVKCISF